jgi:hypothetical protein
MEVNLFALVVVVFVAKSIVLQPHQTVAVATTTLLHRPFLFSSVTPLSTPHDADRWRCVCGGVVCGEEMCGRWNGSEKDREEEE